MEQTISHHIVPRETFTAVEKLIQDNISLINAYIGRLLWWNDRINLMSRDVSRETVLRHIRHSLLITQFPWYGRAEFIVDAGTGGGLPGIPLAIVNPGNHFVLNDIISKKVLAIKQISKELNLNNIDTFDGSISHLPLKNPFLLISKHAFKIDELLNLTKDLPWTNMIFYKGMDFIEEIRNINETLNINVFDLFENSGEPLFKNKAIIRVYKP